MSFSPAFMVPESIYENLKRADRRRYQHLAFQQLPGRLRTMAENLAGQDEHPHDLFDDIMNTNSFSFPITSEEDEASDSEHAYKFLFPEVAVSTPIFRFCTITD